MLWYFTGLFCLCFNLLPWYKILEKKIMRCFFSFIQTKINDGSFYLISDIVHKDFEAYSKQHLLKEEITEIEQTVYIVNLFCFVFSI